LSVELYSTLCMDLPILFLILFSCLLTHLILLNSHADSSFVTSFVTFSMLYYVHNIFVSPTAIFIYWIKCYYYLKY
ncbi:hypothetical protein L9F63_018279, partial [Diploptera punctata]